MRSRTKRHLISMRMEKLLISQRRRGSRPIVQRHFPHRQRKLQPRPTRQNGTRIVVGMPRLESMAQDRLGPVRGYMAFDNSGGTTEECVKSLIWYASHRPDLPNSRNG